MQFWNLSATQAGYGFMVKIRTSVWGKRDIENYSVIYSGVWNQPDYFIAILFKMETSGENSFPDQIII